MMSFVNTDSESCSPSVTPMPTLTDSRLESPDISSMPLLSRSVSPMDSSLGSRPPTFSTPSIATTNDDSLSPNLEKMQFETKFCPPTSFLSNPFTPVQFPNPWIWPSMPFALPGLQNQGGFPLFPMMPFPLLPGPLPIANQFPLLQSLNPQPPPSEVVSKILSEQGANQEPSLPFPQVPGLFPVQPVKNSTPLVLPSSRKPFTVERAAEILCKVRRRITRDYDEKRFRQQVLETIYNEAPYIDREVKMYLADQLKVTSEYVRQWFSRYRTRTKKELANKSEPENL